MKNFSPEFKTPEQYILDITYKIWEERGIGRIYDWYAAKGPVRTPHGVTNSVESVVKHTLETMHEFPNRELLAEDVIIGEKGEGFLFSHRVRSTATHLGSFVTGALAREICFRAFWPPFPTAILNRIMLLCANRPTERFVWPCAGPIAARTAE